MRGVDDPEEALATVAAQIATGLQVSEELPDLATALLVAGVDSPALRVAAGVLRSEPREARDAFDEALRELGVPRPERRAAFLQLARAKASEMIDGSCTPYDGSKWIWTHVFWELEPCPDSIGKLAGLADSWEDYPDRRADLEAEMRKAARSLVSRIDRSL